ncbi:MAG: FAD:protein FMN transferase [Gammaproteobacteria bacterium]|nr:FAD:protein FMN transferase [Gammaproteobacteria bacterium]MDX5375704.1 FAD:protein FMN transferase [Gammaproteobacteria bacterium]
MRRTALALATALLGLALLAGCSRPQPHSETLLAFGTLVDITVYADSPEAAQAAIHAVDEDLRFMHENWNAWRPNTLGRVNLLLPTGEWFSSGPSLLPLIRQSIELSAQSEGLFNPAIGKLIGLWGFQSDSPPEGPPPDEGQIELLLEQAPRMSDIEIDGIRIRSSNPAVRLDFGAFAKGYAVDRAIERLREHGIEHAIVNAGGDLRAIGRHADRDWRVGIRHPGGEGVIASLQISGDESVFTSGNYERYFDWEGERYHHIIDPRTGRPARGLVSVTVLHDNGAEADAAATALFVAGPADWPRIAAGMGIDRVMVVDENGDIAMTPAMAARLRLEGDDPPPVTLRELP